MMISRVKMEHPLETIPKILDMAPGLNQVFLKQGDGKTMLVQSIIWGLRGYEKKIDKKIPENWELSFEISIQEDQKNSFRLFRSFDQNQRHQFKIHPKNKEWVYQEMKNSLGQDTARDYFEMMHVFSPLERPFHYKLLPIAINFEKGDKELSMLHYRLTQIRREIGREIALTRRREGVIIPNEEALRRQVANLKQKEGPLRDQMRQLRKRLAQLHRTAGSKAMFLVLQNRKKEIQEKILHFQTKYRAQTESIFESIKKRREELILDVETARKQAESLQTEIAKLTSQISLLSALRLGENGEVKCPICEQILEPKTKVNHSISSKLQELERKRQNLNDQFIAALGFLNRSEKLLLETENDMEAFLAVQTELRELERTLKNLKRISPPPKSPHELKKVENELREVRNTFSELQYKIGRLEGLIESTPSSALEKLYQLEEEQKYILAAIKIVEKAIKLLLTPTLIKTREMLAKKPVEGYHITLTDDWSYVVENESGEVVSMEALPFSIRSRLLLHLKSALVSNCSQLQLLLVDDIEHVIPENQVQTYLNDLAETYQIQILCTRTQH